MVTIQNFNTSEQDIIKEFVLNIQNNEFHLELTEDEQPDLKNIAKAFFKGQFWTAKIDEKIVGTIGLQYLDDKNGALKKMFVDKEWRGKELGIAQKLFNTLKEYCKNQNLEKIWLDTPPGASASHRFYEKNGFVQTDKSFLPSNYTYPDRDSKIYVLTIS